MIVYCCNPWPEQSVRHLAPQTFSSVSRARSVAVRRDPARSVRRRIAFGAWPGSAMADEEPDAAGNESLGAGATVGVAVAGLTVTAAFFFAVRLMLRYMHLQQTLTREEHEDQLAAESRARRGPGVAVGSAADEAARAKASANAAARAVAEAAAAAAVAAAEAAAAQERARSAESKVIAARAAADRAAAAEREDAAKAHRRASAPELFPPEAAKPHTPPR